MSLSQAHGNIVNIHNIPVMSMLNGCQNDLATWQNWIVFDKPRLGPEQGSKEEESHWKKRDTDPKGFLGAVMLDQWENGSLSFGDRTGQQ